MDNWPDNDQWERWKNDPSKWKWGALYYNRDDKRLIVPKKNEALGITFNYAHRAAVPITLVIVAFIISIITIAIRGAGN